MHLDLNKIICINFPFASHLSSEVKLNGLFLLLLLKWLISLFFILHTFSKVLDGGLDLVYLGLFSFLIKMIFFSRRKGTLIKSLNMIFRMIKPKNMKIIQFHNNHVQDDSNHKHNYLCQSCDEFGISRKINIFWFNCNTYSWD